MVAAFRRNTRPESLGIRNWTLTNSYADYGTKKTLKFGFVDLPKSRNK
jgi:hypothetical protein